MRKIRRQRKHGKFLSCYLHIIDATVEIQCIWGGFFLLFFKQTTYWLKTCKTEWMNNRKLSVLTVLPAKGTEYFVHQPIHQIRL